MLEIEELVDRRWLKTYLNQIDEKLSKIGKWSNGQADANGSLHTLYKLIKSVSKKEV